MFALYQRTNALYLKCTSFRDWIVSLQFSYLKLSTLVRNTQPRLLSCNNVLSQQGNLSSVSFYNVLVFHNRPDPFRDLCRVYSVLSYYRIRLHIGGTWLQVRFLSTHLRTTNASFWSVVGHSSRSINLWIRSLVRHYLLVTLLRFELSATNFTLFTPLCIKATCTVSTQASYHHWPWKWVVHYTCVNNLPLWMMLLI